MARIRTVKPEFFKHYRLWQAEHESGLPLRLAFEGLWCCADREGRFEWIPEQLKIEVLPYDQVDFSRVLHALTTRGFVVKYEVDGDVFGSIPGFKQHQVVNNKERASELPEPNENNILTRGPRDDDAIMTRGPRDDDACHKEGNKEGNKERKKDAVADATGAASAPLEDIFADDEAAKKQSFALAKTIGRQSAPMELAKLGMSWAEIYAGLVTAKTKADPASYLARVIRNRGSPEAPKPIGRIPMGPAGG